MKKLKNLLRSYLPYLIIIALVIFIFVRERFWANALDATLWDTIGPITLTYDEKGNAKSSEDEKNILKAFRPLIIIKAKEVAESRSNLKLPILVDPSNSIKTKEIEFSQILNRPYVKAIMLYLFCYDSYEHQYPRLVIETYKNFIKKKGLELLFIVEGGDENQSKYISQKLKKEYKVRSLILWDKDYKVSPYGDMPQIILVDKNGRIRYTQTGDYKWKKIPKEFTDMLRELLQ